MPGKDIPHISFLELLSFDKFVHAGIFVIQNLLLIRAFSLQQSFITLNSRPRLLATLCCIVYGGALEIMQATLFQDRSADLYDFIANSFGALIAVLVYKPVVRRIPLRYLNSQ
jgi:VanZ family protein